MKTLSYRILLKEEPEGGYTVMVPVLPGCVTFGDTIEEAVENARDAVGSYLRNLASHNVEIPTEENTLETTILLDQEI